MSHVCRVVGWIFGLHCSIRVAGNWCCESCVFYGDISIANRRKPQFVRSVRGVRERGPGPLPRRPDTLPWRPDPLPWRPLTHTCQPTTLPSLSYAGFSWIKTIPSSPYTVACLTENTHSNLSPYRPAHYSQVYESLRPKFR